MIYVKEGYYIMIILIKHLSLQVGKINLNDYLTSLCHIMPILESSFVNLSETIYVFL